MASGRVRHCQEHLSTPAIPSPALVDIKRQEGILTVSVESEDHGPVGTAASALLVENAAAVGMLDNDLV